MEEASRNTGVSDVCRRMLARDFRGARGTSVVADEVVGPGVKILENVSLASGVRRVSVLVEVSVLLTILGGCVAISSSQLQMDPVSEELLDSSESLVPSEQDESLEMGGTLDTNLSSDDGIFDGELGADGGEMGLLLLRRIVEGKNPTSSLL